MASFVANVILSEAGAQATAESKDPYPACGVERSSGRLPVQPCHPELAQRAKDLAVDFDLSF
jgi:hypothetical protein